VDAYESLIKIGFYDRPVKRRLWLMFALAVTASQAGHLAAYQLRFGGAAIDIQSTGAHTYFLSSAKTALGVVALAMLAALFIIGLGRLAAGRRLEPDSVTPFVRTLAAFYTVQLGVFVMQETAEAVVGQGGLVSVPALLLWGAVGQLPVALVASLAWRWLRARVRPALAAIRVTFAVRPLVVAVAPTTVAFAPILLAARAGARGEPTRRGPPVSSF
jgi:hypothetical protein